MGEVNVAIKVQNWLDIEKIALGERLEPPRTVETQALENRQSESDDE